MLVYQIYPRSFLDTNGDGIGDLPGITARLDHIASLGVDMLWISPFFKSPMKDFGYDVSDYRDVDPMFGTLADFKALVAAAKARGIGVLVDMVVSHTSDQHPWFQASQQRRQHDGSDTSDWYLWADPLPDGSPPNNWVSVFGGSAWHWNAERRQYVFHTFLDSQPDLNLHHPAVQQQVLADMRFWLELGVAGFRFDACNHYFQDLQLRSNPPVADPGQALHPYGWQEHLYDKNRPEVLPFLERIRALLDAHGAFSIAEVGGADGMRHMVDYVQPGRLHSGYSFELLRADGSAGYIAQVLQRLEAQLGSGMACHALSNHDKPRVVSRWGAGKPRQAFAKQMLALLACLKGAICLYQGEELGLPEAEVPADRLQDPFGKRFWPRFKGRDGCRTPMPWQNASGVPHSGFSSAEPWLPLDPQHLGLDVAAQERDPDSVLAFARRVLALRRSEPALHAGSLHASTPLPGVLRIVREHAEGGRVECLFNLGDAPVALPLGRRPEVLIDAGAERRQGDCLLAPCGFVFHAVAHPPQAGAPAVRDFDETDWEAALDLVDA